MGDNNNYKKINDMIDASAYINMRVITVDAKGKEKEGLFTVEDFEKMLKGEIQLIKI